MRVSCLTFQVYINDEMISYIVSLCEKTRDHGMIVQGASPRASLALTALAKATAWIQGRDYVLPRDVGFVFGDCIEHRLVWSQEITGAEGRKEVMGEIFRSVKAPQIK